jgi:hypothetical protein
MDSVLPERYGHTRRESPGSNTPAIAPVFLPVHVPPEPVVTA